MELLFSYSFDDVRRIEEGILGDSPRPITEELALSLQKQVQAALLIEDHEKLIAMSSEERQKLISELIVITPVNRDTGHCRDGVNLLLGNPFEV